MVIREVTSGGFRGGQEAWAPSSCAAPSFPGY